ncbi:MAG TPA: type II toxin-antitoxin system HicB family antitoxin [Candidatus Aenigmarchaeota archaeon]|nr:type II toxin-antitoxin system HicB family antitoxin [Candidatus Aenigmarchaeota archaeon]
MGEKNIIKGISANLIELPIIIYPEGNWFVSEVPIFNIASQGKTIEEALENIKEAIELYFEGEDINKLIEDKLPISNILTTTLTFDMKSKQIVEGVPKVSS